jgi:hypothetical protein
VQPGLVRWSTAHQHRDEQAILDHRCNEFGSANH